MRHTDMLRIYLLSLGTNLPHTNPHSRVSGVFHLFGGWLENLDDSFSLEVWSLSVASQRAVCGDYTSVYSVDGFSRAFFIFPLYIYSLTLFCFWFSTSCWLHTQVADCLTASDNFWEYWLIWSSSFEIFAKYFEPLGSPVTVDGLCVNSHNDY